ncbi:hypothetical protein BH11BAC3_BH11BAC3_33450 [soil metagenome]
MTYSLVEDTLLQFPQNYIFKYLQDLLMRIGLTTFPITSGCATQTATEKNLELLMRIELTTFPIISGCATQTSTAKF